MKDFEKEFILRERIYLKLLSLEDASDFFEYRSSPEVYEFLNWFPKNISDAERYIFENTFDPSDDPGNWRQFGIYLNRNNKLIGDCGYSLLSSLEAEIVYMVSPSYQGEGIGTEAVSGLVDFLFDRKKLIKITAQTAPENVASTKILKKLGFEKERRLVNNVKIRGKWRDDLIFSLLK